ncbi:MAG: ATP-binding protein, partial [Candidatus Omnitrophica bacterium]|nr:ATP-binding protein [Candidatus Omnitrophota bacterium]
ICFSPEFGRQMRFIAGPRQSGKTTLVKAFLKKNGYNNLYYNWDVRETRMRYRQNSFFYMEDLYKMQTDKRQIPWICFDEIHKMPKWKNILKGIFDSAEDKIIFIVTGSARLEMFQKSGDSLAGRYFMFKLFPFILYELTHNKIGVIKSPSDSPLNFIEERLTSATYHQDTLESLLSYSGFPEPFLKASHLFNKKWHNDYIDRLIGEDLRDLTHIRELENVATLIQFIPERVGSPLSLKSLSEDVEVSHSAIRTYLKSLELCYVLFFLRPYAKSLVRSVRKEQKCYLYDWSMIKDTALRFENYIAVELKVLTELWNDAGKGDFQLFFVRTRDGRETDFLVVKEGKPWILFEAKLTDVKIQSHHYYHARVLGGIPIVQLTAESGIAMREREGSYRVSASRFFGS